MRKGIIIAIGTVALLSLYVKLQDNNNLSQIFSNIDPGSLDKRTRMDLAMQQEFERTKDPKLGYVPKNRLKKAYEIAEQKRAKQNASRAAISGVDWKERGPTNLGGRTRAILIDPNDGTNKTIFAAAVSGGLWKTTDITKENPDWASVDDFLENMAITTIAYDPTSTTTMYIGSGEGFFNVDAVQGNGIWKSTDGGDTWNQLSSTVTDNFSTCAGTGDCNFLYVNKIVVTSSGTVLAATRSRYTNRGGILRSTDGGTSWTKVLTGLSGTNACTSANYRQWASDIEIGADGDIYASFGIFDNNALYKSTDDGVTWGSAIYTSACTEQRIELATAPSNADYIYALVQEDDASINKIMRSTNGGTSWTTLSNPSWFDQDCGAASTDFTRGQAWYDLTLAVDPNDEDVVYIGGVDLFKSTDGGSNWTQITNWAGNCDYAEVHADQHTIVYQPGSSDVIYFGNDGGVYVTENGTAVSPTFTRKESGYVTAQFYSVAMNPTSKSPNFIGGTQDNGSNKITELGVASIVEVTGGDGGFAHIDQDNSNYQFTAFTNASVSRSEDGGLTFTTLLSNSGGQFINPSDLGNTDNIFYGGFSAGSYFFSPDIEDASPSFFSSGTITEFNGGSVLHVSASQNTSELVFFGLDNGRVVRVNNAGSSPAGTNITGGSFPSGSVSCIAIEDGDDDHLLVTFSNYGVVSVWETTDGGTTWTDVEGDLPDMPVRWALFNPNNSDQALIATELGVWSTDNLNGSSTDWEPSNTGLANVRTDMLQIRSSDNLVVAASHGRGLFISDVFTVADADFVADRNTIYAEASINFTDASYQATSWSWDFGDGGTSTDENPTHTYKRSGKYAVSLTINSGADTETKTDYIHVLPNIATPFSASDGGNFETNTDYFGSDDVTGGINLWERGAPGAPLNTVNSGTNAWKTALSSNITQADYTCALYSPNFNFTNAGTYTLSFRKSMESAFTNAPIGVNVQYSLDNGENWTRLGTDDGSGTNWYDKGPNSSDNLETSVIFDRYGFNSDYSNQNTSYDVSSLAGNATVAFRIVLHVDAGFSSGYNVDGFMVDDFEISGPTNEANVNITENAPGSTLSLDGTDDYASLSNLAINESFTAELWINPTSASDGQTFLAKHDGSGNDIFKIGYNNGGIEVDIRGTTTSGGTQTTGIQHLAVSVDKLTGTTSQITVYRDGDQVFQNTINEVIGDPDGLDWVVGQDWDGIGVESDHFSGTIDELRIWNTVRTEAQIRANNFLVVDGLDTDLIGYWQFNENTGSSTQNIITSNQGTLSSATWTTSSAPIGKGASYSATISGDGSTSYGSMLDIDFNGVSGSFDVYVFEVENSPIGTQPESEYTLNETVKDPYFIINTYGAGTFSDASLTLTYGSGAFTESDASRVYLIKRDSKSNGSWPTTIAATSVNTGTGVAVFDNVTSFSQTLLGTGDVTTPVVWGDFSGERDNNSNLLKWQTLAEIDNERFEILRSVDGKSWEVIADVYSKAENGNSNETLSYNFSDESYLSSDIAYYRLRQIDFDGKSELSSVVTIDQIIDSERKIDVFPNPASTNINLNVYVTQRELINYSIIDINGRIAHQKQVELSQGNNQISIDINSWNRGIYFVKFSSISFEETKRILIN